jgi:hypothetical protein
MNLTTNILVRLSKLSDEQAIRWYANVIRQETDIGVIKGDTTHNLIMTGFNWGESLEGSDYWSELFNLHLNREL